MDDFGNDRIRTLTPWEFMFGALKPGRAAIATRRAKWDPEYQERHGIPFIIAVRDHDRAGILAAFERRLGNDTAQERAEALRQVERIAELRLKALLP